MAKFWFTWMGATTFGFAAPLIGSFIAIDALTGGQGPDAWGIPFEAAFPVILGFAVSVMATCQWLVIRRLVPDSGGWIPATAGGVLLGSVIVFGVLGDGDVYRLRVAETTVVLLHNASAATVTAEILLWSADRLGKVVSFDPQSGFTVDTPLAYKPR
jgi:hypothetical protein